MKNNGISRRRFLQAGGTAAIWLPSVAQGYTATEMRDFYADGEMSVNVSKWELDTPALCVDLDLLEANLDQMASTMTDQRHSEPTLTRRPISAPPSLICRWTAARSVSARPRSAKRKRCSTMG